MCPPPSPESVQVAQLLRQRLLGKKRDAGEGEREWRVQATCAWQRLTATRPGAGEDTQDTQDVQDMPEMHDVPAAQTGTFCGARDTQDMPEMHHVLATGLAQVHARWPSDAALPLAIWPIYEGGVETLGRRGSGEDTTGGGGEGRGKGSGRGAGVALVGEEERAYIYAAAAHAAASFRAGEGGGGGWGGGGRGGEQDGEEEEEDRRSVLVGAAARKLEGPRTGGASGGAAEGGQARWAGDEMAALDMLRAVRSGSAGASGRSLPGHACAVVGGESGGVTHSEMTPSSCDSKLPRNQVFFLLSTVLRLVRWCMEEWEGRK